MSGAIFCKNGFACEISMDVPGRCEFLMLISHVNLRNVTTALRKRKVCETKKLSTHCDCTKFQIAMYSKDLP